MIGRRELLSGAAALLAAPAGAAPTLLDRAIRRAGGAAALDRVRLLAWQGEATVLAGGRRIDLAVETRIVPFRSARSNSWPRAQGPSAARLLVIEPDGGWLERNGTREALAPALIRHERAQYALYGLMLLVPLRAPGAAARPGPEPGTLAVTHPAAPDTLLGFDPDGRLAWASNRVPRPDGEGSVAQRFAFTGEIADAGVRWPARIEIAQDGQPYFALRLTRFSATA